MYEDPQFDNLNSPQWAMILSGAWIEIYQILDYYVQLEQRIENPENKKKEEKNNWK